MKKCDEEKKGDFFQLRGLRDVNVVTHPLQCADVKKK